MTRRTLRALLARTALALALFGGASSARAEPRTPGESSPVSAEQLAARAEFQEGSRLAQSDDWSGALERYTASQAGFPHATTLYNIGYCHERLGDFAGATRDTQQALLFEERFPARALSDELRERARSALTQLARKVSLVRVETPAEALAVRVDGRALEVLLVEGRTWGFVADGATEPAFSRVPSRLTLILNPGTHRIEWQAAQGSASRELALRAGDDVAVTLPAAPASTPPAPAHRQAPAPLPKQRAPAATPLERERPLRTFGIAAFAASGGAALVGLGAGLLAADTNRKLETRCTSDGACPPDQAEQIDRFHTQAGVASVALVSSAALAGVGIALLLLDSSSPSSATLTLHVASDVTLTAHFH